MESVNLGATDAIKEALSYPLIDKKKWIIVGVIFLIINLFLVDVGLKYTSIAWVTGLIAFILNLFLLGYGVSVTKENIIGNKVPEFDFLKNFVDGIKAVILYFIYFIIPIIISVIVALVTGVFTNLDKAFNAMQHAAVVNSTAATNGVGSFTTLYASYSGSIPTSVQSSLGIGLLITAIVAIILFILFMLFVEIAFARMAEEDSLKAGLNIGAVFSKIGSIGWGTYIAWYILMIIVAIIFGIIAGILSAIPYVGALIVGLFISSFMFYFNFSAVGKIYKQG
jgi:hypothetical protein